ncbi:MAG: Ribosomal RNA small subunit methyltransferase I [Parcubacteria group bacterium GW2011_GWA2_43_17]|nr:MAG: Ribosomal RNA small subunit methyltransferase I [Parcubacteria group bacterium GW2011_GWA2_43_17]KKT89996.1 MAG: Ribosomal RNA small subunit methyltransferase I [Parcubacteria group bacterium GW2011_GWF2_45_11]KKT98485.1 MAG: Ribosomal RNA small subunit methyltransferase I [Parcubacteria group bacterium GW2011_GWC2_45_15]OGY93612.1 MAG: 16S rRNA (cytidine(1402)-2'-O)-methyltransferase [Candidatus Komeilibacteria bacterium RIFOXYC2_FULL_45_12]HAH04801.1 16S rRNA (cytidine(1402)-2'-O)-met
MGILYVVATPIGNLEDITLRALKILEEVDLILCEDTRVTRKLLDHYGLKKSTLAYHQHTTPGQVNQLISLILGNRSTALVTDAGTPGLSDPGGSLIKAAIKSGVEVMPVPGPSALTAAISVAGWAMDKFLFLGFLPHKKGRQMLIKKITESEYPVVLFESVHRIDKLLNELSQLHSAREILVGRELTKKFETVYRGAVEAVKNQLTFSETKGEFVVIISPTNYK